MNAPFSGKGLKAAEAGALIHEILTPRLQRWKDCNRLTVATETREFALDVIFRLMGIGEAHLPSWRRNFHDFTLGLINCPEFVGSPPWRSRRARAWMNAQFSEMTKACIQRQDRDSLMGAMVHGVDEEGHGLTEAELFGNLRLLALAGHETTASIMSWMLLLVARDQALWDPLCEEAHATEDPPLDPAGLANFPFAEALFLEALRMYPPAWFLYRRTTEAIEFEGVHIAPETVIVIPLIALSRDPEVHEAPDQYRPDRWLGRQRRPNPIEMYGFGHGPHFCLGYRLAMLEGIQFIVSAARALCRYNKRPALRRRFPNPRYLPLTHAPFGYEIALETRHPRHG